MYAVVNTKEGTTEAAFSSQDDAWEFLMHREIVLGHDTNDLDVVEVDTEPEDSDAVLSHV